ncbi:MAG: xanthine dehydrogenase family protein molybdopterin-binding subunit [Rhodospirillales bacterium]|jgi:CO/xanthine dehydrogenase Mo-binding subunit|nr:xanthine dehydrogenase family protein molybdopterin-binding subunit [Rhodospirillales bacterium]MDP6774378.1 xanthine dehydrogenase family protein molybdopterin-binding subunit [Rhodospirillales bacterium]
MIGEARKRTEDERLITGRGLYVDDIALPGMGFVAIVRSPHAHARIDAIDGVGARRLPGVRGVFTIAELPELRDALPPPVMNAMPIRAYRQSALADGVVRFVGEPVAAVLADSRAAADDGAEAVAVEYSPLAPVTDAEAARREGAPLVHPEWGTNLAGDIVAEVGDVDNELAASDIVVGERFHSGRMTGLPLEPRGVVATWDEVSAMLTVWTASQMPYGVREYIMVALDLPRTAVRVIAPDVGGGFGPKAVVYGEDLLCATLARRHKRPVKWIESRSQAFMATVHGHDQIHWARLGVTHDGIFTALDDRFVIDNGAYLPRGSRTANNVIAHLMGPYRFKAFRCRGEIVCTNKAPNTPFRGAGRVQSVFVTERLIELAARKLGLDPVELRRRNLLGPDELPLDRGISYRPGMPVIYDSGDYPALLAAAEEMIGYGAFQEKRRAALAEGRRIGCAIALYTEGTGVTPAEGAAVTVSERGRVQVAIGAPSQGQGHATIIAQVCAEHLGVPFDHVTVVAGDTARFPASPVSSGTFASRIAAVAGSAVALACEDVAEKVRQVAARLMECAPGDLVIEDGHVHVKGVAEHGRTVAEVAVAARGSQLLGENAEPGLSATRYYLPEQATWAAGAHAAIVEVCTDTGHIEVLDYAVAHDVGREINPAVVEGQVHGGVAQGLGSALLEEIVYDADGQLTTGTLMDYAVPRAASFPAIKGRAVNCPSTVNELGVKGAGEGGTIPGQAVIANAVADALGADGPELNRMPLSAQSILDLIRKA